jgi:hypothetical protein
MGKKHDHSILLSDCHGATVRAGCCHVEGAHICTECWKPCRAVASSLLPDLLKACNQSKATMQNAGMYGEPAVFLIDSIQRRLEGKS